MARINNVPTIIMKAIVTMNNENLTVNVSGVTITLNTQEMQEGVSTLTSFLEAIVPEDCKTDMLKDMGKVETIIGFISRYRSCFHFSDGQELKQTITLDKNGMMETQWDACTISFDFKELSKLVQEFSEFQATNIRSQEQWDEEEEEEDDSIDIIKTKEYTTYRELRSILSAKTKSEAIFDYISGLGNHDDGMDNFISASNKDRINEQLAEFNLTVSYTN
jgi:hypothetical protein